MVLGEGLVVREVFELRGTTEEWFFREGGGKRIGGGSSGGRTYC